MSSILKNYLVGFFQVPGQECQVIVETPLTGHGPTDYRNLAIQVRKLFPNVPEPHIVRTGSVIESRDPQEVQEYINPLPGMTIRQLFPENPTQGAEECFRIIGSVFFSGQACKVTIRYHYDPVHQSNQREFARQRAGSRAQGNLRQRRERPSAPR
jgi:hypothetical protein